MRHASCSGRMATPCSESWFFELGQLPPDARTSCVEARIGWPFWMAKGEFRADFIVDSVPTSLVKQNVPRTGGVI